MLARTDAETISSGGTGYSVVSKPGHFSTYLNEPLLRLFLNIVIYKEGFSVFAIPFPCFRAIFNYKRSVVVLMRKILLVSHCIINPHSKARGLARREKIEASRRVLEELLKDLDLGIIQLQCPELLYMGLGREPASRSLYDNPDFRKACREIAEQVAKLVKEYEKEGVKTIAYLGVEGSPSCGVQWTHFKEDKAERGMGVFTETLSEVMSSSGIQIAFLGLPESAKYGSIEELLEKIKSLNAKIKV